MLRLKTRYTISIQKVIAWVKVSLKSPHALGKRKFRDLDRGTSVCRGLSSARASRRISGGFGMSSILCRRLSLRARVLELGGVSDRRVFRELGRRDVSNPSLGRQHPPNIVAKMFSMVPSPSDPQCALDDDWLSSPSDSCDVEFEEEVIVDSSRNSCCTNRACFRLFGIRIPQASGKDELNGMYLYLYCTEFLQYGSLN